MVWSAALAVPAAAQTTTVVQPVGNLINTWSVDQANQIAKLFDPSVIIGTTDPFGFNTPVTQIDPTRTLHFVRFASTPADMLGGWIMRSSEVRGLTPAQIADKFALPNGTAPRYILSVDVPPSPQPPNLKYGLLTGIAGPIWSPGFFWGHGGGQQTRIIKGQTADATYNFMDYSRFIPPTSYYHLQPLGAYALLYAPTVGPNSNAGRVAAYLDRFVPAAYSDLEDVYTALDFLNWANFGPGPLAAALNQISPERFDALSVLSFRTSLLFGDTLLERSQSLRLGLAGAAGKSEDFTAGLGRLARLTAASGFGDPRLVSPSLLPGQIQRRHLGLWARGLGEFGGQSGGGGLTGFAYRTGGVVGGIDCQPLPNLVLGFGAGYLGSDLDWDNNGGNVKANNAKFGLYATYWFSRFFLDGAFTGGVNWSAADRNINFPGVNRSALSRSTGEDLALHLRGGVNFALGGWDLTPLARVSYFYVNQDGFDESGADSLNLRVQGFSAQTIRTQLGLRLARTFATATGLKLTPAAHLGWAHDFPLDNRVINASLIALGGNLGVNGFNAQGDSLLAGAGLTAQLRDGIAVAARYDAEIRHGFDAQMVNLGLRFDF